MRTIEMFKVFVSYSTQDLKNVAELQQSLVEAGFEVFVAEHAVLPSEHLSAKISSAIAACDLFILLWSDKAKASEWVSQEIGKAHSLNKQILPLVLTEGLNLPGFISDLKYLPVFRDPQAAIAQTQEFILKQFQARQAAARQKKEENAPNFLVLGGLALWLLSQK
ncbi:toll/interleukin-1 receptor domain-containing protein [Rhodocyclus purpureus]|uniref:toll/interleukin-1 receptor domain-containing protein n=1 Tax=Rhodocyclus purpureus TaxID=1067 RepID=UPI00191427DE|nr:toll/interleukin-1 receptor domain-containing protein [Rhodocyclus purpureus]MBK5913754.1 hypothetical protein [Rhodocyclus purpureus]